MINFHPRPGTVLICNFDGYREPEIVKARPVVVLSTRQQVAIVVPFSTVLPRQIETCHYRIEPGRYPFLDAKRDTWAKGDLIAHVGYPRLDRLKQDGKYFAPSLTPDDLRAIKNAVASAIGLPRI